MKGNGTKGQSWIDPVQLSYASIVRWVVLGGVLLMIGTFFFYVSGLVVSAIPVEEVPELWHMSAGELARQTGSAGAWAWIGALGDAHNLAFLALVFFPAATIVVLSIAAALFSRSGNKRYAIIALAEAVVLVVAASGILS